MHAISIKCRGQLRQSCQLINEFMKGCAVPSCACTAVVMNTWHMHACHQFQKQRSAALIMSIDQWIHERLCSLSYACPHHQSRYTAAVTTRWHMHEAHVHALCTCSLILTSVSLSDWRQIAVCTGCVSNYIQKRIFVRCRRDKVLIVW